MPFRTLIERLRHAPVPAPSSLAFPRAELAVAVLLIEAAQVNRRVSPLERAVVARRLAERFALPQAEAAHLLDLATGDFAAALEDWVFTEAVREGFAAKEREEILAMMWEVVYADGELAHFEAQFMQRMADALAVDAVAAERARGFAFARINAASGGSADA